LHFFQQGIVDIQGFHLVLGVKTFLYVVAPDPFAFKGLCAGYHPE
jgi:hypothetical protein